MRRFRYALTTLALSCVVALVGCEQQDAVTPGDVAGGDVPAAQTVTVSGEFERQIDQRSFTMSGTAEFFSDDMVVVSRSDLPVLNEGDEIEVTGTVHKVGRVEIERETGWDFDPQVTAELEDVSGYLVADSVRVVQQQ